MKISESGSRGPLSDLEALQKSRETNENLWIWLPRATFRSPEHFKSQGNHNKSMNLAPEDHCQSMNLVLEDHCKSSRTLWKLKKTHANQWIWLPGTTVGSLQPFKSLWKLLIQINESGSRRPLSDFQKSSKVKENKWKWVNMAEEDHCQTSRTLQK